MAKSGKTSTTIITFLVVAGVIGAAGYYYYLQSREEKKPEINTTTVSRGDVIQMVTATGQMDVVLSVDIGSQVSGQIKKLHANFNTVVKKDQIIAELDPATYLQRLRQAQADFASTTAANALQKINTERTRELYSKQLVSKQELDQAEAQLAQSNAQLLTRQAAVENAQVDLDRCTIRSPIDGIVISKQTEEGKTVAASLNVPTLFTIANDLTQMEINTAVAEADIGQVTVGQDVNFTVDAFPNRTFTGKVKEVHYAPKTQQNVVTYEVVIGTDNKDRKLLPGMTANVSIIVARRTGVLRVANSALRVRIPEGFNVKQLPGREGRGGGKAGAAGSGGKGEVAPPGPGDERGPRGPGGDGSSRRGREGGGGGKRGNLADMSPEQIQRMMQMRAERQAAGGGDPGAAVRRTVYKLPGGDKTAVPEAASIQLGITDGFTTEVVGGLDEGDVLVTSILIPGQQVSTSQAQPSTSNPFQQRGYGPPGSSRGGRY